MRGSLAGQGGQHTLARSPDTGQRSSVSDLSFSAPDDWLSSHSLSPGCSSLPFYLDSHGRNKKTSFRCLIDFTKQQSLSFFGRCLSFITKDLNNQRMIHFFIFIHSFPFIILFDTFWAPKAAQCHLRIY